MSKNKGGREVRKPKQEKSKPAAGTAHDAVVSSIPKAGKSGR